MIHTLLNWKKAPPASLKKTHQEDSCKGFKMSDTNTVSQYFKTAFLLLTFLFTTNSLFAQPGNMLNNTDFNTSYSNQAMSQSGVGSNNNFFTFRAQANATTTSGTKYYQFNTDSYNNKWDNNQPAYNTVVTANWGSSGGGGIGCAGGCYNSSNRMGATTINSYYTFNLRRGTSYANQSMAILQTTYNPTAINSYTTPSGVIAGQTASGTVTLATALNTNEFLYVAWSTDAFATSGNSGIVATTLSSGAVYNYTIPSASAGATVQFYPFTSVAASAPSFSDAPLLTLRMRSSTGENNTGAYSSYSVSNLQFNGTTNALWSVATNWNSGVTPSTSANLGTVIINANCTMDQNATVGALTINDTRTLTINSGNTLQVGGAITRGGANNGAIVVNGTLQMNAGYSTTFSPSYSATTSRLIYNTGAGSQTRGLEWTSALQPFNVQISNNTTMDADNVGVSGSQAATLLGNLTIDSGSSFYMDFGGGNAALTVGGNVLINGNISISNTTTVGGNWTRTGSIFTITNSARVVFNNATTAQTITRTGGETFVGLEINKTYSATNKITLASNVTVNGALTFTAGVINTGAFKLTSGSAGTIAGTPSNTSHVQGNFEKIVAAANNPTVTFQVGDGAVYAPVSIAINGNVTNSTGALQVSTLGTNHPNFATSGLSQSRYVQRNWTITNNVALTGLVTYAPTFTFVSGDLIGSPTTANLLVGRFNTSWSLPAVGTRTATSTQATGLTAFGDFQIAECSAPNVSNFSTPSATAACIGFPSTVTVNSSTLGNGSFTVTYDLSAPNAATGLTATLTMSGGTGTFATGNILNSGNTTVTIQSVTLSGCLSSISSGNTTSFSTTVLPNVSNFSTPSASAVCGGSASTVTVNSTTLAAANYTVTYNLSGSTTATGNTATMVFASNTGTFLTSNLTAGTTTITITNIVNQATTCSSAVSSGNTVNATVSANSAAPKFVVHQASSTVAAFNGCSGSGNFWGANPSVGRNLVIQWNIEEQFQWSNTGIYYTTDGSAPSGTRGVGAGTTQFVSGTYICTNASRDIATGTIPLSANTAGTTVRYIIGAWNGACGTEGFANNVFGAQFNTTPFVYSYTLINPNVANFRSKATGNWTDITRWEYESVTGLWADATQAPGATGNNNVNIQAAHTITLNTPTSVVSGKTVTVSGILTTGTNVISGTGAVLIDSSSAIARINGAQTYTGNTTIQNGELWIESNSGSIGSTNAVAVGAIGPANVTKLWLTNPTGNTTFANNIIVAAGNADTRVIGGLNTTGTNTFSGTINDLSSNFNLYAAGSGINEFTGNINTNGNPIIVNQEGVNVGTGTVRLSGTNTNTGGTTLRGGTLSVPTNASLGTGVVTIGNAAISGTLQVTDDTTRNNAIAISSGSSAAVIDVAETKTFTLAGASGILTGATNTTKIGKSGNGTLTLNGASTYAGQIQIGGGTVVLGNSAGLGNNNTTANRGVDLGLNVGDGSTSNNVSLLANTGVTVPQSIYVAPNIGSATRTIGLNGAGTATFNNEIFLEGNMTVTGGTGTVTISGAIVNTSGVIVDGGTVVYSGANTYTGATTVNSGTLRISGANRISDSSNLVLGGGTFSTGTTGNSETLGTLDLTASSTIALGTGDHTLTFSNSSSTPWLNTAVLTITGWTGTPGASGTAGKIVVGAGGLSQAQLNRIQFATYPIGAKIVSGEVVPRSIPTVTVTVGTYTYNGTPQGPNSISALTPTPTVTYTYTGANAPNRPTLAGTYSVIATVEADNEYFETNSLPTSFDIDLRPLTITANDQEKCAGTTFTFTGTEFTRGSIVSGDTLDSVTLTSTGAGSGAAANTYSIVASNAVGTGIANYDITYLPGDLVVNPLPTATIAVNNNAICVNQASPVVTFTAGIGTAPFIFTYNRTTVINGVPTTVNGLTSSGTVNVPTNAVGTITYTLVSVQDANGCSQNQGGSVLITVNLCTQLRSIQCGRTMINITDAIQALPVTGATQYRFILVRTDNPADIIDVTASNYWFKTSRLLYGKSYIVTVALFIGSWGAPGPACTLTAPPEPAIIFTRVRDFQCNKTLRFMSSRVEAMPVYSATSYEFEVTSAAGTFVKPSVSYHFSLTGSVPGGALPNTAYTIRVRTFIGNTLLRDWGAACVVTTPSARMSETNVSDSIFNVKAFPNPFASHFSLDIESSSDAQVELKVYDMIGRQLEVRKATVSELSVLEVGRNYPSGVYNLVVSQGEKVKSIRMIKR